VEAPVTVRVYRAQGALVTAQADTVANQNTKEVSEYEVLNPSLHLVVIKIDCFVYAVVVA